MYENFSPQRLTELVEHKQFRPLRELLTEMNEVDIAAFLGELEPDQQAIVFRLLPKELAAEVFAYLDDSEDQERLIGALSDRELREVLDELYLDDAVDIIEEMPASVVSRILRNTGAETRQQINELLNYPKDSAGSIMTTEFVSLRPDATVSDCFQRIRREGVDKETIYTCYVTHNRVLMGVVTVRQLLLADAGTRVRDIMEDHVISVETAMDREEAAQLMSRYDLSALPVVDAEDRVVGIITFDDVLDVFQEEATEDIEKMAAIIPSEKPYMQTSVFRLWRNRIPWLLLLMVSATFTGRIIAGFESALASYAALTIFIPMLMDTGGNCGGQASVTVIRALSLGEIEFRDLPRVLWKELRTAVLCALTLFLAVLAKALLLDGQGIRVALVVSLTVFFTVCIAKLVGCTLPMLAKRLGFDPAVMASPFITTVVDALSLLVYFAVAARVLGL
ncbi:MAG: magnesium transporter [Oscillospiraceae bacterium]|jgi:magnesium transporter|nr:magnesium transporter [Oscillospiraceae bacterium]